MTTVFVKAFGAPKFLLADILDIFTYFGTSTASGTVQPYPQVQYQPLLCFEMNCKLLAVDGLLPEGIHENAVRSGMKIFQQCPTRADMIFAR